MTNRQDAKNAKGKRMPRDRRPKREACTLLEFFQQSPLRGVKLDLRRSRELPREIDL
jgi:hypothetical protein